MNLAEHFGAPQLLAALLLVPLVAWGLGAAGRARARRLVEGLGARAPALTASLRPSRRRLRQGLFLAALGLGLAALSQPRAGSEAAPPQQRIDLLVCLDVSRSMLARDVVPDRLGRAQEDLCALAQRLQGDRLGLVAFAGAARLIVPLTQDLESFAELVRATDILSAPRGGTDLGAALTAALQALPQAGERGAAVVLVTDGEDLEGHGERVALECQRRGIPVHCVAFGTRAGSKITVEEGGKETFLRDRAGQEVVSAVDLAGLRRIAALTGGEFLDSSRDSLTDLSDASLRRSAHAAAGDEPRARKNRFQWPLSLAFGLWLTELCTLERKRR